jgi:hypothetical protein
VTEPIAFVILGVPRSKANQRQLVTSRTGKPMVIKSRKALNFVSAVKMQCPKREDLPFRVPVRMTIHLYYQDERSDLDESALLDALQSGYTGKPRRMCWPGVLENDRLVRERHVFHWIDDDMPRAEVEIEER